jgi:hypothetical protein
VLVIAFGFTLFFAQPVTAAQSSVGLEVLPAVDARTFRVQPKRQSASGRVVQFIVVGSDRLPDPGKVLLVKKDGKSVYAFRVIRTTPDDRIFLARKIRKYKDSPQFQSNEEYDAIEKIADILKPVEAAPVAAIEAAPAIEPEPVAEDTPVVEPQEEVIAEVPSVGPDLGDAIPYDKDLDLTTSPGYGAEDLGSSQEFGGSLEVEERTVFAPFSRAVGLEYGYLQNLSDFQFSGPFNVAFGATAQFVTARNIFARSPQLQDRMFFSLGFSYYRRSEELNDFYYILPVRGELLYSLDFSETISLNFYGGLQYNWVFATSQALVRRADALDGLQFTGGTGFSIRFGPQWIFQTRLGYDRISGALMVEW